MKNNTTKPTSSRKSITETSQRTRRVLEDAFKTKVVLTAHREEKTLAELATEFGVHPNQISQWKAFFLQNATSVFSGPKEEQKEIERLEQERDELHKVIGKKEMDIDFLKKLEEVGIAVRVDMVEPDNDNHSIKEQCELLSIGNTPTFCVTLL